MTIGRLLGNRLLRHLSHSAVLRMSAVFGGAGLLAVMIADDHAVVIAAVVVWGVGASLGFPVSVSAAGSSGPSGVARVGIVSTIGYLAFLAGPPVIGLVGAHVGLRLALVVPLIFVGIAAVLSSAVASGRGVAREQPLPTSK
jgi:fucose permease